MSRTAQALEQLPEGTLVEGLRPLAEPPGWLVAVSDHAAVEAALTHRVPELASGELILRECEVRRVRITEDGRPAQYRLTVERAGSEQRQVLELCGEVFPPGSPEPDAGSTDTGLGTDGWRCYLPELRVELRVQQPDAALPALPLLTDADASRALLERGIRAGSPAYGDLRIQSCSPQVMRYKPGSRCTVLYHLEFPPELRDRGWPNPVVAKAHHGDKGRNAYRGMSALWSSRLRRSTAVAVAEPLAFLPELNVLVQGPVQGRLTLKELIRSSLASRTPEALAELFAYVAKAAVGLSELHSCGVRVPGDVVTWDDEQADLRARIRRLAELSPEAADAAAELLGRLETHAAKHPPGPLLPAHRSFRPAQVLLNDGAIGFIDFDGFCSAEPALDLALFRTTMKDIGLRALSLADGGVTAGPDARREQRAQIEELCEVFLARYEAVSPVSRARVALWEALDLLTLVLNCWIKVKPEWLEHRLELLSHHLRTSGLSA